MAPPRGKQKQEKDDDDEEEESPELSPVDSADEEEEEESDGSVYDSEDGGARYCDDAAGGENDNDDDDDDGDGEDDFEDQGSSDDDDDRLVRQRQEEESDDEDIAISYEKVPRSWKIAVQKSSKKRGSGDSSKHRAAAAVDADGGGDDEKKPAATNDSTATPEAAAKLMHTDDWSSDDDDEEGTGNRIGRVPIHWYDDYDHVGYNVHGSKVAKSASADGVAGDRIDQAIAMQDNMAQGKFVVHDALNDTNVELSARQVELIRRMQASAVAHPEHEANPEYIDYFSGVNPEISGLNSNQYEPKARFQPSRWEELQVERLLDRLAKGKINMDYLTGKIKDMNDVHRKKKELDPNKPFLLWKGDEEDELNMRKGPQHIAAPKKPPPGHAESYIPPDEYLPTDEELKQWQEMDSCRKSLPIFDPWEPMSTRFVKPLNAVSTCTCVHAF
jgi:ribosome biogenesis protein ERB1